jgi:hypothetical protein
VIDLVPDEEQRAIAAVAAEVGAGLSGRSASSLTLSERSAIAEVGVFGLGLGQEVGGAGCGVVGDVLVAEAFGACLAPISLVAPVATARALASAGDPDGLLSAVVDGSIGVALACDPGGDRPWRLLDLPGAVLVAVMAPEGLLVVEADALHAVLQVESIDEGITLATCAPSVPARAIVLDGVPRLHAQLLLAAVGTGVAGEAVRLAVEYACDRQQYGKPIGAFQAVKHRCVDMAIRHEAALSAVRFAAVRADAGLWDDMVAVASMTASRAARENPADAIQVFGGIGFTAEGGLHRLLQRGWVVERLLGPTSAIAETLVERELARSPAQERPAGPESAGARSGIDATTPTSS